MFEAGSRFDRVVRYGLNVIGLVLMASSSADFQNLVGPEVIAYFVLIGNIAAAAFTKAGEFVK